MKYIRINNIEVIHNLLKFISTQLNILLYLEIRPSLASMILNPK